jgi:hypothetical protein
MADLWRHFCLSSLLFSGLICLRSIWAGFNSNLGNYHEATSLYCLQVGIVQVYKAVFAVFGPYIYFLPLWVC